ncbi:hypothetical protein DXG01_004898 [Tephrocybe rancida]|nr:hypothetical protein DXG01_004898 [Tephrocybe rancida]
MDSTTARDIPIEEGGLHSVEKFWRDHYEFLKDRGYTLRRRYEPDWIPSWADGKKERSRCEDSFALGHAWTLDATRSDGTYVILKRVDLSIPTQELVVGRLFSSPELATNPRNHCVPFLDIIDPKEGSTTAFIVMPLLNIAGFAPFKTIGEAVEYFRQIFEALQFMHHNNVAHGDCKTDNIMADLHPLYGHALHPALPYMRRDFSGWSSSPAPRTSKPVKYYLIDFDLSNIYGDTDARLMTPPWGGDKSVPEHLIPNAPPCDPFPVDVYCIGNVVKQGFLDGRELMFLKPKQGFEFMRGLISDMVNDDPSKRPTMDEVVARFDQIIASLSEWTLRSPILDVGERFGIVNSIFHWARQLTYVAWRLPAIPKI